MDNRDRSIETLLGRREGEAPPTTDQCVDAESLAAWTEGGLPADARAAVEHHAAGCARCQALLASMARTVPDVAPRPWWRSVAVKWLVPVTAVATALVVWVLVEQGPRLPTAPQPPALETSRGPSQSNAPAPAPVLPQAAPDAALQDRQALQRAQSQQGAGGGRNELDKLDVRSRDLEGRRLAAAPPAKSAAQPSAVAGGVAGAQPGATQPPPQAAADAAARFSTVPVPAPAPPPPAARPVAALPPPAAGNVVSPESKPASPTGVAEAVGVQRQATAKAVAADNVGAAGGLALAGPEIQSPDPNYRWRIVPPAGIQRSTDGGMTWAVVDPSPAAARSDSATLLALTAGSSPSRDVCWIVGRAGLVLLSTNGATWQRRPFPEAVALTAVHATSATSAIVTAADGRQFSTADGGASWQAK